MVSGEMLRVGVGEAVSLVVALTGMPFYVNLVKGPFYAPGIVPKPPTLIGFLSGNFLRKWAFSGLIRAMIVVT